MCWSILGDRVGVTGLFGNIIPAQRGDFNFFGNHYTSGIQLCCLLRNTEAPHLSPQPVAAQLAADSLISGWNLQGMSQITILSSPHHPSSSPVSFLISSNQGTQSSSSSQYLLNPCTPGKVRRTSNALSHLALTITLNGGYYCYGSHWTEEGTEAQNGQQLAQGQFPQALVSDRARF